MPRAPLAFLACTLLTTPALAGPTQAPIVGGTEVELGAYPDIVGVKTRFDTCTGTLIAPDLVLTAAHCLESFMNAHPDPQLPVVAPGVLDVDDDRADVVVARAFEHPELDVVVLELATATGTPPRPLATGCAAAEINLDAPARAIGFGATSERRDDANTLLHETPFALLDLECSAPEHWANACEPGEFVIAASTTGSVCNGDSGGPLFVETSAGPVLLGVASMILLADPEVPCAHGTAAIYVRADRLRGWIEQVSGRTLVEPVCVPEAEDEDEDDPPSGGCAAAATGGGTSWLAALAALAFVLAIPRGVSRAAENDVVETARREVL